MIRFAKIACLAALLFTGGCATTLGPQTAPSTAPARPVHASKMITQITNPGFENWKSPECPDTWVCIQHTGELSFRFFQDKAVKTEGTSSMRVEKIATQPWGAAMQFHYLEKRLQPMNIRLSAQVKTSNLVGAGAGLIFILEGTEGSTQSKFVTGTGDWQRLELTAKAGPGVTAIRVQATVEAESGVAWFDDIRLEQVP